MGKNKVKERCQKEEFAKFFYTSQKMFGELKASRIILYILALIPVVLTFIPSVSSSYAFICSVVSFSLTILNEVLTSFLNEYKEKAIMEHQLYETGITGSEFSKIEYDRETTNELNELAIRKGMSPMRKQDKLNVVNVPDEISDDYSYLYLCRKAAATTKYMLSRIFYIYCFLLVALVVFFIFAIFFKTETAEFLTLIITIYPLASPIIKACGKCKECMKDCTKICADIDNYFADGDISLERLARMYYYAQNLEFEMMTNRPTIYNIFKVLFKRGTANLEEGVTTRFKAAIVELKGKSMMHQGIIAQPKGKALITKVDYDMEQLDKIEKRKKSRKKQPDNEPIALEELSLIGATETAATSTNGEQSAQLSTTAQKPSKSKTRKKSDVETTTKTDADAVEVADAPTDATATPKRKRSTSNKNQNRN